MMLLGDFLFQNFEIPDKIEFGTAQILKVHKMIGGQRVVDAMGPDPHDVRWDGIMEGEGASDRARQLEAMAAQGAQVTLVFNDYSKQVVIASVDCDYGKPWHCGYRICVTPLDTDGGSGGSILSSLDDLVGGDLGVVTNALSSFDTSGVLTAAVSNLSSAVDAVGTLQGSFGSVLDPVTTAASIAISAFATAQDAVSDTIDTSDAFGIVTGVAPQSLAGTLLAQVGALQTMSAMNTAGGYLARVAINVNEVTG